jgi:hypothetical protein
MSEESAKEVSVEPIFVNDVIRVIVDNEVKKGIVLSASESYVKKYRVFLRDVCKVVAVEEEDILGKVVWDGHSMS